MPSVDPDKQYLSTGDAAAITGWTVNKIRTLCEQGRLPAVNTSTTSRPRWTIRRCDLEAFLTPSNAPTAVPSKPAPTDVIKPIRHRRIDAAVPKVFG